MKKKFSLKRTALSTLIGLAVAGTVVSFCTPVTFAQDDHTVSPLIIGDTVFEISDIVFEPDTAAPGDKVKVRALTNAGKDQIFSVMLEMPVNDAKTEHVYLTYGNNDILEGSFTVGDNWSNGEHKPLKVIVTDSGHKSYDYDIASTNMGSITVHDSGQDFDAPVLNSISFDKTELRVGEAVTISVDVTHASDIDELIITFADEGNLTHSVSFENGKTVHTKDLSGWNEGSYRVSSVYIRDKAGNREYYEENDNLDEVALSSFRISNNYEDTQGPLVTGVSFDKAEAVPGDVVTIMADAHDSTEVDFVTVDVAAPGGDSKTYYLFENTDENDEIPDGTFSAQIYIDNKFPNGEYTVTHISAVDSLGNESDFTPGDDTKDITVGSFTVAGSAQDSEAPQIKRIEFLKGTTFRPGQTAAVQVWLSDKSDIWDARLHLFEENTNDEFDYIDGDLQDDGSYLFVFDIDNQWFNGNYDVRISTGDSLSNNTTHLTGLQVTVHDSPEDYHAPEVVSVTADKTDVKPGDVVTLTADIKEDSMIQYVYAGLFLDGEPMYDGTGDEVLIPFSKGEDGLFRANFEVTHTFLNTDYDIKIHTCDQWDNYMDDIDTDIIISVSESREHIDPPVVTSILFDKTECVPGDTFTMTADAEDDLDNVKYVKIWLAQSDGTYNDKYNPHLYLTLYPDENGDLSATGIVDNTWMNGTYEVVHVIAKDELGNVVEYDNDLLTDLYISKDLKLNFLTVSGSTGENSGLHVSQVLFDKEKVNIGETINITAKTTGPGTVKEIVLELTDESWDRIVWSKKIHIFPDDDGNLATSLRIDPSDPYWRKDLNYCITSVTLIDNENSSRFYAMGVESDVMDDLRDIESNSFTVDTYAPPVIEPADYSGVFDALEGVPEDLSLYTRDSLDILNDAIAAIVHDKTELEQLVVNGYAAAIRNAVSSLELKPADYTELDRIMDTVPADKFLSSYTDESVNALKAAIGKVNRSLKKDKQHQVDEFVSEIRSNLEGLKLKSADYTKTDAAIRSVPVDISMYTDESVKALNEALSKVERGLSIDKQDQVDVFTDGIEKAISSLDLKPADYSGLDAVLKTVPEDLSHYTEESVKELKNALEKADRSLKIDKQDKVDEFTKEIETAISGLKMKEVPEPEKKTDPEKRTDPERKTGKKGNTAPAKKANTANKEATYVVKNSVTTVRPPSVVAESPAPKTGDRSNPALWGALSGAALTILCGTAAIIRRKRKKD